MNQVQLVAHKATLEMLKKFNNRLNRSQMEPEDKLSSWAEFLAIERGYTVKQIAFAIEKLMTQSVKFMPSAYEIEAELKPRQETKEEKAPLIANEIIAFVRLCSFDLEHRYIHTLSDEARSILRVIGGTQSIRQSDNFETMKAQLERSIKGALSRNINAKQNFDLNAIGIEAPKEGRLLDFTEYLPNGA